MRSKTIATLILCTWLCLLCASFFVPLIMGACLAILLYPIYKYLISKKIGKATAATFVTGSMTLGFIIPILFLAFTGIQVGLDLFKRFKESAVNEAIKSGDQDFLTNLLQVGWISDIIEKVSRVTGNSVEELIRSANSGLQNIILKMGDNFGGVLGSIPRFSIALLVLILTVYYLLKEGEEVLKFIKSFPVFPKKQTNELVITFAELSKSVLLASLISGVAQSILYSVAMLVAGLSNVPFLALLVFLGSFLPVVGAAPLTFGLAIYYLFTSAAQSTVVILFIAAILSSIIDNVVRPIVLKGGANLHPLIAMVGLFGGLSLYGFPGIFVGPIIAGMSVAFLRAWLESE